MATEHERLWGGVYEWWGAVRRPSLLAGSQSYYYDALYRLTNPNYPGQSDAYIYDANGNRTLYNEIQYSYDAADQLTCARFWWEQQCPSGGTAYAYDANGNQTSRGTDSFTYDHENRMTGTSIGGVSGTYTYNGDGLRVSRNIGGTGVSYTWDVGAGLPVILQDSQGNTYVYGLDLISRTDSGGNQEYYLYDGLGSTTDLTNGSGTTIASYSYDVFGAIRSQVGSSTNEFKFTGEQWTARASSTCGRGTMTRRLGGFLSQDPAGAGHPYTYAENNPVNFVDPRGLCIPEVNCPPGLGGGTEPPSLPRSKEGGFRPPPTLTPTSTPTARPAPGVDCEANFGVFKLDVDDELCWPEGQITELLGGSDTEELSDCWSAQLQAVLESLAIGVGEGRSGKDLPWWIEAAGDASNFQQLSEACGLAE